MRRSRLLGKGQIAVCMRSGIKCKASELVRDGHDPNLLVLPEWADPAHPQERPYVPDDTEGLPRWDVVPDITPKVNPVLTATPDVTVIELTWTPAEFQAGPRVEEYDVYRDAGEGFVLIGNNPVVYDLLGGVIDAGTSMTDEDVVPGIEYHYKVIALSTGPSAVSNIASAEIEEETFYILTEADDPIMTEADDHLIWPQLQI
jgi:hypothetical protein